MDQLDCGAKCIRIVCLTNETEQDQHQMTTEQQTALTEAAKAGYYEIPRSATAVEVAEQLGISHQALSERLRRAHSQLVDTHLRIDDGTDSHEGGE
ncbi:helix-turn-helix domain-containing protein [Halococcus salsus]|uniref:helix-turn-helix domain-containing protein n=1 Tax=Halococcus salsus TaxID=2162894 RepID=UPI0013574CB8|nr:helix-turn-helix domain-containing protein [Halococcus salsus]